MAIQYYMRAYNTNLSQYVDWIVIDAPDSVGTFSGFPTNQLIDIVVNRVVQSKVENFLKKPQGLGGPDGYYFHVNSYDTRNITPPIGNPTQPTGIAVERGITSIVAVSSASNASPISITTTSNHGLLTGRYVTISGVTGNIAANGTFQITVTGLTTFTLNNSTGSGTYVSGGTVFTPNDFSTLTWDEINNLWRFVLNTNGDGYTQGASQNLRFLNGIIDGYEQLGTNPALTGIIRLPNNQFINWRNALSSGDIQSIGVDNLNRIKLGSTVSDIVYTPGIIDVDGYIVHDGTGSNVSLTGFIREQNNTTIIGVRNQAGSGDIGVLATNSSNNILLGDSVNTEILYNTATNTGGAATGLHQIQVGGTPLIELGSVTNPSINNPFLRFVTGAVAPSIFQVNNTTNSAVGQTLLVQAQNATGTTATGGTLQLTSGTGTPNDTNSGSINIQTGGVNKLIVSPTLITSDNADFVFTTAGTRTGLATTTIAAGSNGAVLPQATINVANTLGTSALPAFPSFGVINVTTSTGVQAVYYTGTTGTTFTGCSGGTGTMSTGGAVNSAPFITQTSAVVSAGKTQTFTVQAQNNTGTTSTGGDLALSSGTGTSQAGNTLIQTGGVNQIIVSPVNLPALSFPVTTGKVVITGNLEVQGTTTTVDSTVVDIIGRVIHANWADPTISPNVAVPSQIAGYSIHRGNSSGFARDGAAWIWTEGAQNSGSDGYWRAQTNPADGYGTDNFTTANSTNSVGVMAGNISATVDPNPVSGTLPGTGGLRTPNNLPSVVARNLTPTTTIAAASNLASLPQATINVASTTGFTSPSGTLLIFTSTGQQTVTYTGTTGTTFTGAVGGSGVLATGNFVGQTSNATTIAAGSNNTALPQGTINVASTVGFPTSGTIRVVSHLSNTGTAPVSLQTITYTGTGATTFTGCTGGTGTMFTGDSVTSLPIAGNADLVLLGTDFGNRILHGSPAANTGHIFNTTTGSIFDFQVNSVSQVQIAAGDPDADGFAEILTISPTVSNPRIYQLVQPNTGANNGFNMMLQAQNGQNQTGATTNNNGGLIILASGVAGTGGTTATGFDGYVDIRTGITPKVRVFPTFSTTAADNNSILFFENKFRIDTAQTTPLIRQDDNTTNSATGTSLTLQSQNATGTTTNGGPLRLQAGTGTSTDGYIDLITGTTIKMTIYPTTAVSAANNNSILFFENKFRVDTAQTTPLIRQDDKTANGGTGETFTLQAQNETGTTSTGGTLVLTSGTGTTVAGNVNLQTGAVTRVSVNPTFTSFLDTAEAVRITPVSAGTTQVTFAATVTAVSINQTQTAVTPSAPFTIQSQTTTAASGVGGNLTLNAGNATGTTSTGGNAILTSGTGTTTAGNVQLQTGAVDRVIVHPTFTEFRDTAEAYRVTPVSAGTTSLQFASTVTLAKIFQADLTTNNVTGAQLTVQAQNETGTTSNGGPLALQSGTGTSNDGYINLLTGTTIKMRLFGTTAISATDNNSLLLLENKFRFDTAQTTPLIRHDDKTANGGTGETLTVQAQNETGTTSTGGALNLTSGTGTTTAGAVNLQVGGTTTASLVTNKFVFNKGRRRNITAVSNTYLVLETDDYLAVTASSIYTITLPATPTTGDTYEFKDINGTSGTNAITISGNGANIDGLASTTLNANFASLVVTYTGAQWSVS